MSTQRKNETTVAIKLAKQAVRDSGRDWTDIIEQLTGVVIERNEHGPCPIHAGLHPENSDGFRMVALHESGGEDGVFHCAGKGEPHSGDGFDIVQRLLQRPKRVVAEMIYEAAGGLASTAQAQKEAEERREARERKAAEKRDEKQQLVLNLFQCATKRAAKAGAYIHPYAQRKGLSHVSPLFLTRGDYEAIMAGEPEPTHSTGELLLAIPRISLETDTVCGVELISERGNKWTVGATGRASVAYQAPGHCVAVVEGWATAVKTQEVLERAGATHIRAVAAGGKHALEKTARSYDTAFVVAEMDEGDYAAHKVPYIKAPKTDKGNDVCDWQDDKRLVERYVEQMIAKAAELGVTNYPKEI